MAETSKYDSEIPEIGHTGDEYDHLLGAEGAFPAEASSVSEELLARRQARLTEVQDEPDETG